MHTHTCTLRADSSRRRVWFLRKAFSSPLLPLSRRHISGLAGLKTGLRFYFEQSQRGDGGARKHGRARQRRCWQSPSNAISAWGDVNAGGNLCVHIYIHVYSYVVSCVSVSVYVWV